MTKLQEIAAYLGQPLYAEWRSTQGDTEFAEYVNFEYRKMLGHREDAERDADRMRQTQELRAGG